MQYIQDECHVYSGWMPCIFRMNAMYIGDECHVYLDECHVYLGWMPCILGMNAMYICDECHVYWGWMPCIFVMNAMYIGDECHVYWGWMPHVFKSNVKLNTFMTCFWHMTKRSRFSVQSAASYLMLKGAGIINLDYVFNYSNHTVCMLESWDISDRSLVSVDMTGSALMQVCKCTCASIMCWGDTERLCKSGFSAAAASQPIRTCVARVRLCPCFKVKKWE